MKSHLKYLQYVLKHKWYVFLECVKLGVPFWRALIHDWQKFTPAEWGPYRQRFFVERGNDTESKSVKKNFKRAWLHHLHHGPHHWEYWLLKDGDDTVALEMPDRYRREMLADWNGAGLAINGINDTEKFYEKRKDKIILHEKTREWIEEMIAETPPKENDLVVELVLSLFPDGFKGVCIDVGAYHPTWLSNSYELEQSGWDVYCIEPNPYCIPDLLKERENVIQCAVSDANLDWAELYIYRAGHGPNDMAGHTGLIEKDGIEEAGEVEVVLVVVRTLNRLLPDLKISTVDLLLIDTEGDEMGTLHGFDIEVWKPRVIVVENIEPKDTAQASSYLGQYGYVLRERIIFNDIYERIDND